MQVVRSPHAHATFEHIDTAAALEVAGVLGVFTAADLGDLGPLPCTVPVASLAPMIVPPRLALATGRARHVGDPVAFVVAETRAAARDAAELVGVDWQPLPSVVDGPAALLPDAPRLWDAGAEQPVLSLPKGRPGRGAFRDRRRGACRRTGAGQQSARHLRAGTARRDRPARR